MTTTEFMTLHPELSQAGEQRIRSALAHAALFISSAAFGDRYEKALEYKACVILASGKYGQLQPAPNTSTQGDYQKLFEELRKLNPIRGLVT